MSKATSSSMRGQIDPHVFTKHNETGWIYTWVIEVIESTNPEQLVTSRGSIAMSVCCGAIGGCTNPTACADQYETFGEELDKLLEPTN